MNTPLGKRGGERVPQGMERETLIAKRGFRKERSKLAPIQVGRIHGFAHVVRESRPLSLHRSPAFSRSSFWRARCALSAASETGVSLRVRRDSSLLGARNAPCWSSDSSTRKVPFSKSTSFHRKVSNSPRRKPVWSATT